MKPAGILFISSIVLLVSLSSWLYLNYQNSTSKCLDVPTSTFESISSFLQFVEDVSSFHPNHPAVIPKLELLKGIYQASLANNCEVGDALSKALKNVDHADFALSCLQQKNIEDTLNITVKIQGAINFVSTACNSVGKKRKYYQEDIINIPSVVVVGAGPTGLGNAIESFASGANIFEKRTNYSRSLWLDLMSKPWSEVHEVLNKWGWKYQHVEAKIYSNPELWTVRIQTLERFLSKIAAMVGIPVHYGLEFVTICNASTAVFRRSSASPINENPCDDKSLIDQPFQLIIGSDGAASSVRKSANIEHVHQESFVIQGANRTLPGIKQVTMIANFDVKGTKCPELAVDNSGAVLSPWYPSFSINGVNSVWKRFYYEHCQLQVLFHDSVGSKVWSRYSEHKPENSSERIDWENEAISWDYLLDIVNVLFLHKYPNKESLQNDLLRKKNGEFDIQIFPVMIRKAVPLTSMLEQNQHRSVIALVGDASVTAHYRLGIGINNAFSSFHEIGDLVKRFGGISARCWACVEDKVEYESCKAAILRATETRESHANKRVDKMVNFQLSAMYYESYCDFVVAYNTEKDMSDSIEVFRRDSKQKRFDEIFDKETLRNCYTKSGT